MSSSYLHSPTPCPRPQIAFLGMLWVSKREWVPLVKQAVGEMKFFALKHLLQNLPGFRISFGNSLADEQGFSGFHWVLSWETKIAEEKKFPSLPQPPGHSTGSDHLSFAPSEEGTGFRSLLLSAACALEEPSQVWVSITLPGRAKPCNVLREQTLWSWHFFIFQPTAIPFLRNLTTLCPLFPPSQLPGHIYCYEMSQPRILSQDMREML